jgi:hypothetical protein
VWIQVNSVKNGTRFKKPISAIYSICFAVTIYILITDKNLQTNFGSVKPYFIHWYGLLITGIVDVAGALMFLLRSKPPIFITRIWFIFMPIFMVADTLTYAEVYFKSPEQFAQYLFGLNRYPGALPYTPGAFDVLFGCYIIGILISFMAKSENTQ